MMEGMEGPTYRSIEDKVKDFEGVCPSCEEQAEFYYVGMQKVFFKKYEWYNCLNCQTTLSKRTIDKYNKDVCGPE